MHVACPVTMEMVKLLARIFFTKLYTILEDTGFGECLKSQDNNVHQYAKNYCWPE